MSRSRNLVNATGAWSPVLFFGYTPSLGHLRLHNTEAGRHTLCTGCPLRSLVDIASVNFASDITKVLF